MTPNFNRRQFLTSSAAGAGLCGWLGRVAAHSAEPDKPKPKACILLWMAGGPSHIDTFDLKPDAPKRIGGEFRPIDTSVTGIQISEHFPKLAKLMNHAAILRGMSTVESDHELASDHLHTGYQNRAGGIAFPSMGAIVSKELGQRDVPLPNFVCIGKQPQAARSGFLGPAHQPLGVTEPDRGLNFITPAGSREQFARQFGLLQQFEKSLQDRGAAAKAHRSTVDRAVRLMNSQQKKAFDLSREKDAVRDAYGKAVQVRGRRFKGGSGGADAKGRSHFGQGCLMARRLVEAGVPFVEVVQGNSVAWDTHRDNFPRTRSLSQECDVAMATLIADLDKRGLLDSTLIVWMGEFGRTPQTTSRGGRNHWARAWSSVLIGGGIKGGQVIGKTDRHAAEVVDRPISVTDFLGTVCTILGVDYKKQNHPSGVERPIPIVDTGKGVKVVSEVL